jgi:ATP-dependent helicase/nuclease subunit B
VGKELHLILAKCTRYASERGGFPNITKDELAHFAHTESAARLSALFAGTPRLLAQGRKIAETAKMLAGRLWEEFASSRFVPLDFELSLAGPPTPLTGVPPDAPSSYIPRGVADRVDVWRRDGTLYLRVVDYKSGKKTFSLTDVYHGVSAQMPFYLNLALESVPLIYPEKPADTQAAAALYIPSYDVSVRSSGPLTAEEAETAKAAVLRHSGLVLDDPGVLAAMDSRLSSGVLPVTLNKDGTLSKKTLSASPEQMRSLQAHIRKLNDSTAFRIASGMVEANPLELRETPCDRCSCRAACHFDPSADPFRAVTALSGKDDFFNALLGGSHHASNP